MFDKTKPKALIHRKVTVNNGSLGRYMKLSQYNAILFDGLSATDKYMNTYCWSHDMQYKRWKCAFRWCGGCMTKWVTWNTLL